MDIDPRAYRWLAQLAADHPGRSVRVTRCKGG